MKAQSGLGEVAVIARRPYWRTTEAQIVIDAWCRSGESQAAFAKRYGVDPKRIGRWAGRLARGEADGVASAGLRFHPVRVISPIHPAGTWAMEIALGDGCTVRVSSGFLADDLARAVAVLRQSVDTVER